VIAISTTPEGWRARRRVLVALRYLALALILIGSTLPQLISWESPTPMPYAWPAHHALYLHTDGRPAQCTVDDGVTEPFTVSIVDVGTSFRMAGQRVAALDNGPATVTCTEPVTADLDPGPWYTIAGSATTDVLAGIGLVLTLLTFHLLNGLRRARVG